MYVSVSNLHFPQMKVTSEKPPEANFPAGACPLDYGMQNTPSLFGNLARQFFLASYVAKLVQSGNLSCIVSPYKLKYSQCNLSEMREVRFCFPCRMVKQVSVGLLSQNHGIYW